MLGQRWSGDVVWSLRDYMTLDKDYWRIREYFYLELFMYNNLHDNPTR